MEIKLLNKSHAKTYRSLRLRSFEESPLAFSESYQDEKLKSVTTFALELEAKGTPIEYFVLGAYTPSDEFGWFCNFQKRYPLKSPPQIHDSCDVRRSRSTWQKHRQTFNGSFIYESKSH